MAGSFEIKKAKNDEFYFVLKAHNGEVILQSETYKAKPSAKNGIASVQKNCESADRFEKKETKNGKFSFNLKAANHQVIGSSETYNTAAARDAGVKSVMKNGTTTVVKDLTVAD